MLKTSALLVLTLLLASCYHGSLYASRPKDKAVDEAITKMWADEIRKIARDGDWIISRSLTWEGDMIATLVGGEQYSHASVIDVTHGTIVEATTPMVREIPLEQLMARNWYVVLLRPNDMTAEEAKASLELQRAQVGKPFDLYGFIGYPEEDKWYCSELVYWASGMEEKHGKHVVILPRQLLKYSQVLYYSGRRDDHQVQEIAASRMNIGHDTAVAGVTDDGAEVELEIEE
jgi:uncharacterized protein YycO